MVESISNQSSVIPGTLISGAVGAAIGAGTEYLAQKSLLKNTKIVDEFKSNLAKVQAKEVTGKVATFLKDAEVKFWNKQIANATELIKNGKVNLKGVALASGIGAAIVGGAYLAYRGIKALFTKE